MKMALNSYVLLVEDNPVNQEVGCAMMGPLDVVSMWHPMATKR